VAEVKTLGIVGPQNTIRVVVVLYMNGW
jgi:hypothetical protein